MAGGWHRWPGGPGGGHDPDASLWSGRSPGPPSGSAGMPPQGEPALGLPHGGMRALMRDHRCGSILAGEPAWTEGRAFAFPASTVPHRDGGRKRPPSRLYRGLASTRSRPSGRRTCGSRVSRPARRGARSRHRFRSGPDPGSSSCAAGPRGPRPALRYPWPHVPRYRGGGAVGRPGLDQDSRRLRAGWSTAAVRGGHRPGAGLAVTPARRTGRGPPEGRPNRPPGAQAAGPLRREAPWPRATGPRSLPLAWRTRQQFLGLPRWRPDAFACRQSVARVTDWRQRRLPSGQQKAVHNGCDCTQFVHRVFPACAMSAG